MSPEIGHPPRLPSKHAYFNAAGGVALPLLVAFLVWRRVAPTELSVARLLGAALWTYPLMVVGCVATEGLLRALDRGFYAAIGDNPGQVANLVTGYLMAHGYWLLLAGLFFLHRR